ncbi:MAG: NINE protein [Halosimplex sp.]
MSNDDTDRDEPADPDEPDPDDTESGESADGQPPADGDGADPSGESDEGDGRVSDSVDGDGSTTDDGDGSTTDDGASGVDDGPDHDAGGAAGSSASGQKGPNEKFCVECGAVINENAEICPECGVRQPGTSSGSDERIVAALLAILLGSFGAHKFYLGNNKLGVLYLCFFWTGIPGIVGIVEGLIYLTKDDDEFRRQYVDE